MVVVKTLGVVDQYMVLIAVTLLFTVLALAYRKVVMMSLAAFSWFAVALIHFIIGITTSVLTMTIPLFYCGIGLILALTTIKDVLDIMEKKRTSLEL